MAPRDLLSALLSVAILGLNFVAIRIGLETLPPIALCAMRFALAAVPAVLFVPRPKAPALLVIAFGVSIGVGQFGLLFMAIHLGMPAGLSSLLIQLQAPFTVALAWALFAERPSALQGIGGALALAGVGIVATGRDASAPLLPFLLVGGAALAWASANIIVKRIGAVDRLALMVWGSLAAVPPLFGLALATEGWAPIEAGLMRLDGHAVAALAFQAYPTQLLAFALWTRLLTRYPAASVAPFALLVPAVGLASTHVAFGEPLGGPALLGAAVTLAGIGLSLGGRPRAPVRNIPASADAAAPGPGKG